jgi:protein-disulfide isomerase
MTVHASGLILAFMIIRKFPLESEKTTKKTQHRKEISQHQAYWAAIIGLSVVAVIAISQLFSSSELKSDTEPSSSTSQQDITLTPLSAHTFTHARREVSLADGKLHVNISDFPIIGSPDAENVVLHFFDFTCPSCRRLHPTLMSEHQPYANQSALVMVPVPLDAECNPQIKETSYIHRDACAFARIAIALWNTAPQAYPEYDHFLFENEYPPTGEAALAAARQLAGNNSLDQALSDSRVSAALREGMIMFYSPALIQKSLPALVTRHDVFTGFPPPGMLPILFSGNQPE